MKKRKRVLLEASEYEDLIKYVERVEFLERIIVDQMERLDQKEDVFHCKGDPVFAFNASLDAQGIKITEGGPAIMNYILNNANLNCPTGGKGKKKLYAKDDLGPSANGPISDKGVSSLSTLVGGTSSGNGLSHARFTEVPKVDILSDFLVHEPMDGGIPPSGFKALVYL